jgi:hypothetical protein
MAVQVDWSRLESYKNDKRKSFEELCYQVARRLYEPHGTFYSIDDSGGGDGVEFYLTLADGTEWGWQAKFYHPSLRLDTSRKRSIKKSLTKSLEKHQRLTKWYLCTPTEFTTGGDDSFLTLKRTSSPGEKLSTICLARH